MFCGYKGVLSCNVCVIYTVNNIHISTYKHFICPYLLIRKRNKKKHGWYRKKRRRNGIVDVQWKGRYISDYCHIALSITEFSFSSSHPWMCTWNNFSEKSSVKIFSRCCCCCVSYKLQVLIIIKMIKTQQQARSMKWINVFRFR